MSNREGGTARAGTPRLAIVVPCYNEEAALRQASTALLGRIRDLQLQQIISESSFICFVDDGSTDRTWQVIGELHAANSQVRGLKLTRNFGHQGALLAGMLECDADAVITIDADLQDDEGCLASMVREYLSGHDLVLGVRDDRSQDSMPKRVSAQGYYRLLRLLGVNVVFNHADFRLLSRRAIAELAAYPETNLFLRGVVPLLGLPTTTVHYARRQRVAGESKYSRRRMFSLAWEGISSFSIAPLRFVAVLGFFIAAASLGVTAWALAVKLVFDSAIPGWASTVVPMYFLGGVQILCLGVIGEYVGKIYLETKRRPRYSVEVRLGGGTDVA